LERAGAESYNHWNSRQVSLGVQRGQRREQQGGEEGRACVHGFIAFTSSSTARKAWQLIGVIGDVARHDTIQRVHVDVPGIVLRIKPWFQPLWNAITVFNLQTCRPFLTAFPGTSA
jgi:hypothetical protein